MKTFCKFPLYLLATLFLTLIFGSVLISNQLVSIGKFENVSIFNSRLDDYAPSVTADDRMMVFNSRLKPGNNYDIFVSYNENGSWSKPVPFTELNSTGNDETPYITPDGQIIVFASDREGSMRPSRTSDRKERITYDIYISYFADGQWTSPKPILGDVNTIHNERTPSITQDGKYLYFSRWRFGAIRESKILRAENRGGQYVNCIELPYPINTGNYDMAFTPTFLGGFFFASRRAGGFGGWDIYYTPSDREGTRVFNMSNDINSNGNDLFLTVSRQNVYICSDRVGSLGGYDIFRAPLISLNIPEDDLKFDPVPKEIPDEHEENIIDDIEDNIKENEIKSEVNIRSTHRSAIAIRLIDQKNHPVACEIMIELFADYDAQSFLRKSKMNSGYSGMINIFPRDDVKSIRITTLSPDIVETQKIIDVEEGSILEEKIFIRYDRKHGRKQDNIRREALELRPIYFSLNSSEIKRSSMPKLHRTIAFLRKYPNVYMDIIGHTDKSGTFEHNEALSRARAQAVRKYFIEMGISPERLGIRGAGSREPAIKTNDRSEFRFNRRVEFELSD